MNVLLVNYEYPPIGGGASNATLNLAKELVGLGHKVVVMTSRYGELRGKTIENGIVVFRINSIRKYQDHSSIFEMLSFILTGFLSLGKIVKEEKVESAILFFSIPCGVFGPFLKSKFKIPYLVSLRGGDVPGLEPKLKNFHRLLFPIRKLIFRNAKGIIANSEGLAIKAEKADHFPVKVIPNGVDTNYYFPDSTSKINDGVFRFLFVGRFQDQKNILVLLEQIYQLNLLMPSAFILNIVGDGPLKGKLINYIKSHELEKQVNFHPWLAKSKLRSIYQQSDCLVNYSHYEGMPNVVLEAMACALPVIASNIMGHDVLVLETKSGFIINLNEEGKLLEKLKYAINNREIMNKMGLFARKMVEDNYSWRKTANDYVNYLNAKQTLE